MSTSIIGIIGAGNLGKGVAQLTTQAGHRALLTNSRGPETLTDLVASLGELASANTFDEVVNQADIVVLALPYSAALQLSSSSFAGKTVIDATNYYADRDGHIAPIHDGTQTSSAHLAAHFSDAQVIKVLNNVDFLRLPMLATNADAPERTALPLAGNDQAAKTLVTEFLDAIGFDSLDLGDLSESWKFEPNTPIYVAPYFHIAADSQLDPMQQFMSATPTQVPRSRATELVAAAQR